MYFAYDHTYTQVSWWGTWCRQKLWDKKTYTTYYFLSVGRTTIDNKGNQIMCLFCYLLRLTFVQVSLVFELEYGYSTNKYTN